MNCNHRYEIAPRPDYLGKQYECTECGHEIDCETYEYISKFKADNAKIKAYLNSILTELRYMKNESDNGELFDLITKIPEVLL